MYRYESVNSDAQQYSHTSPQAKLFPITEPLKNETRLPPKSFIAANKTTLKRGLYQSSVGLGALVFWVTIFILWQWSLNNRVSAWLADFYYSYDFYVPETRPQLLLTSYLDLQSCDAGTYSSLEPNLLVRGSFTLGEVKAMDIAFNMVVGRGTQALLLWISYYATTDILMRLTENTPIRFDLFSAVAFNHSSFTTFFHVLKGLFTLRGWRAKFIMVWILNSSVFLIVIPTLIDTMSGYIQNQRKDVGYDEGNNRITVDYYSFNATEWRTNHTGDYDSVCTRLDGYQWGLSEFWVSITIIWFGIWLLGTFTVWMDAQHACELRRKGRGLDTLRAVVDLADAVHGVLGDEISGYSGAELTKAMKRSPRVQYGVEVDESSGLERITLGVRRTRTLGELNWNTIYG